MKNASDSETCSFGPFYFDSSDLLFRGTERIPLEPIQARVLRVLLQHGDRLVTKSDLIEAAWHGADVSDESIARAIYRLRKCLGPRREEYIQAVSGRGYRFVCPVLREPSRSQRDLSLADTAGVAGFLKIAHALANDYDAMLGYWDLDLRCQFANSAYEVWFGRSQSRMLGISMPELLGPLFELNLPYIHGVEQGHPQHFTRSITLPNGIVRLSLASYFPDLRDGKVQGFSVLVLDAAKFRSTAG